MTLEELKACDKDILTPADISGILKIHSSRIIEYARQKELPFPSFISGNRVKIPKAAFIHWMEGKQGE